MARCYQAGLIPSLIKPADLIYAIVEIDQASQLQPLNVGQFVTAEIRGKPQDSIVKLPLSALRPRNRVWLVDENNQLQVADPEVLRIKEDALYLRWLSSDEQAAKPLRIITSSLALATSGMRLTVSAINNEEQ